METLTLYIKWSLTIALLFALAMLVFDGWHGKAQAVRCNPPCYLIDGTFVCAPC